MGERAKLIMYITVQSRFDSVLDYSYGNLGGNSTMVCYLLDGGAVFAELWTLSRGHGYV